MGVVNDGRMHPLVGRIRVGVCCEGLIIGERKRDQGCEEREGSVEREWEGSRSSVGTCHSGWLAFFHSWWSVRTMSVTCTVLPTQTDTQEWSRYGF